MRQRGDFQLIDLLNYIRTGNVQSHNINILKSRVIKPSTKYYPHNALHIFAKNTNGHRHTDKMLDSNKNNFISKKAIDNLLQQIAQDKIDKLLEISKSNWGAYRNPSH